MASNVPPKATGLSNQTTNKGQPPEYATESEIPFATDCPECHTKVVTNTEHKAGPFTWVACIMLASFGFFLGCCAVPFCIKSAKDVVHICPNCNCEIGRHSRF